jgi:hypothetical protein
VVLTPELQEWIDRYEAEELRLLKEDEMGRYASDTGGGDFKQAPVGNHIARCVGLIDLGTQRGEYQGEPTVRKQVLVQWELPNETTEIGGEQKPFLVSKFYTNSLSEKANLRKDLESWRSVPFSQEELRKFDLQNILGKPCMVNVIHNEKGKAKVTGVAALAKGVTCPPAVNATTAFWLDEYDDAKFMALSDGIKDIIKKSDEHKELNNPGLTEEHAYGPRGEATEDDTIPF